MHTRYWRWAALVALAFANVAVAAPVAYTNEAAFLADLATLGYTAFHEGFESDAAWGAVRSTISGGFVTASAVTNAGVTWTSNNAGSEITTSEGAAVTASWGAFAYPHGSYSSPAPGADCTVAGDCGDGFRGAAASGELLAVGGWLRTNTPYAKIGLFLGAYPANPIDFGETCDNLGDNCVANAILGTTPAFFGAIDPAGFTAFEYRELEGTSGDQKLVFADDFRLAGTAVTVPIPAGAALLASALIVLPAVRRRR